MKWGQGKRRWASRWNDWSSHNICNSPRKQQVKWTVKRFTFTFAKGVAKVNYLHKGGKGKGGKGKQMTLHQRPEQLGADPMEALVWVDLLFKNNLTAWDNASIPMKDCGIIADMENCEMLCNMTADAPLIKTSKDRHKEIVKLMQSRTGCFRWLVHGSRCT